MIKRLKIFLFTLPVEGYIWTASILLLTFINAESTHFTLCPFNNLGIDFCPGCGLGRSIHYFISFEFEKSSSVHPLGGIAFFILLYRIFFLARNSRQLSKTKLSY